MSESGIVKIKEIVVMFSNTVKWLKILGRYLQLCDDALITKPGHVSLKIWADSRQLNFFSEILLQF